ncbi:ABC transporter ATP-binding protein [Aneurinibacillus migulanus]|uniref:ABC transporter ATP-binding protein n=1 Tax=Aneurinibacillus migulanus TaxID=47500 RepID=UPI002E1A5E02|nr:ABC transporter ATP-binding protein [Aneurinibacillus migulanus]
MITFSSVSKTYEDGTQAIRGLDFTIQAGELFVLIGPSGCGKTTTMKMINRLIEPTEGKILLHDREIHMFNVQELRWNIGYVLQQIALFPHMTIAENIALVPEMKKWKKKQISERIDELLHMVGLDPATYRDRKPSELSGGQQQRVGVIRALAADPEVILMDEPFSALDPLSREQLQQDIRSLQQKIKKTIVFVTHDMDEAMAIGDRVCLMKNGETIQIDTPQNMILRPANDFVREFIGNRKSSWLTTVDVISETRSPHLLSIHEWEKGHISSTLPLYIVEEDGSLSGKIVEGSIVREYVPMIPNDMRLAQALPLFEQYQVEALPVVKGSKVIGILSYRTIVHYLAKEHEKEISGI